MQLVQVLLINVIAVKMVTCSTRTNASFHVQMALFLTETSVLNVTCNVKHAVIEDNATLVKMDSCSIRTSAWIDVMLALMKMVIIVLIVIVLVLRALRKITANLAVMDSCSIIISAMKHVQKEAFHKERFV